VTRRRPTGWLLLAAVVGLLHAVPARAERLPFRAYGPGEGLAGDHVRFILQDSRGFLWLATNSGVSRFDGHTFRNYDAADGLPFASARKLVEAPDGTLYALGRQKLARRPPSPRAGGPEFEPVASAELSGLVGDILDLAVGPDGSLALVGALGAARLSGDRVEPLDLGPPALPERKAAEGAWTAAFDGEGALWVARTYGITRIGDEGPRTLPLSSERQVSSGWGWLPSMTVDRSGRVWLITVGTGAWRFDRDGAGRPVIAEVLDRTSGLPSDLVRALHEGPDGTLWIGTSNHALVRIASSASGRRFVPVGPAQGLPDVEVYALNTDAQGNLWVGTAVAGLVRLAVDGSTSWGEAEGLSPPNIGAIEDDPRGGIVVMLAGFRFATLRDGRVDSRWSAAPALDREPGWGGEQLFATGSDGRLWLATAGGVAVYRRGTRLQDLATRGPEHILDKDDGLPGTEVHRLFRARDGSIWFGLIHSDAGVCRVGGDGNGLRCFGADAGLPIPAEGAAFAEDAAGNVWVGLYEGGVYRHREDRFETWPEIGRDRQSTTRSIRRDDEGRLWVAGTPGLVRIDAADSPRPSLRRYTMEDGLSAVDTMAIESDRFGRIYVGSVHGVDLLHPDGGKIRRFTSVDGLPVNHVRLLHRDPMGDLWVGTARGIARLVPRVDPEQAPPRAYVTSVSVAGTPRDPVGLLSLATDERTVEFAFTAASFRAGETMRFQWRLEGASDEWTSPRADRAITFAGLAPGGYRFEVRAVDGEGLAGTPASFEFEIRPPFWTRAWFLTLAAIALGAAVALVYRLRVRRLVELERVRTRIATDLHDDIGASLSQIAVLSQYASRQAARGATEALTSLERITELSGDVVDAMSDVVWSINPARDRMSDLVHRMRRFAVDLFLDGGAVLRLDLPESPSDAMIDPEARRQIYLVFKEALRNAASHSGAREVEAGLRHEGQAVLLTVRDDGGGIDGAPPSGGAGLESMRRRAQAIGATLEVRSRSGGGTEVLMRTPLPRRRFLARWTGRPGAGST
jgi:signal transduction histidine kinase/ligand-binding sensor domain-containing protein